MNLWPVWDYIVNVLKPFCDATGDCLYNGMVLTMALHKSTQRTNYPEQTIENLTALRNSLLDWIQFVEQEIESRQKEIEEGKEE